MNIAALDLNLLVALEALLGEASVGRAAKRLGLSQPATSHALAKLRDGLGDPLLVRAGTRMQLTPRAEALRGPLQDALDRVRSVVRGTSFDPRTSTRRFRILMSDYVGHLLLPLLEQRIAAARARASIEVVPWRSPVGRVHEIAQRIDAAITCVPDLFTGFHRERLFTDEDTLVFRAGHPAARRRWTIEACVAARHVAVVGVGTNEDPVDTWLREEGHPRNVALVVPHYLTALHTVAATDLLAIVPRHQAEARAKDLGIVVRRVPLDPGTFDEFLVHPPRTHDDPGARWLRGLVREASRPLGRPLRSRGAT